MPQRRAERERSQDVQRQRPEFPLPSAAAGVRAREGAPLLVADPHPTAGETEAASLSCDLPRLNANGKYSFSEI